MNSVLMLLPDEEVGVFLATNSDGGGDLTTQHTGFQRAFFDHYYPAPAVAPAQPPADFAERAGRFVGTYRYDSTPATTAIKIMALMGPNTIPVSAPGDGTLRTSIEGIDLQLVEVEPLYFRQVDGPFAVVFREDSRGRITRLFTDLMPQYSARKLAWYETGPFNMVLLQVCALVFLTIVPVGLVHWIRSRGRARTPQSGSRGARMAYRTIVAICVLNLLFLVGFGSFMFGSFPWSFVTELHGVSGFVKVVMGLGVAAAALTVPAVIYTALAWKNGYWGIVGRTYYTLVTVAAVAFVWFLEYGKLLGWRY
jgi:hypothetical protein